MRRHLCILKMLACGATFMGAIAGNDLCCCVAAVCGVWWLIYESVILYREYGFLVRPHERIAYYRRMAKNYELLAEAYRDDPNEDATIDSLEES